MAAHLSNELANCQRWLVDNKLSLHLKKTESILFGAKGRLKRARDFVIHCDGVAVSRVKTVKYLGVLLDCCMTGNEHVKSLLKSCNSRLSFLYRNARCLDFDSRRILCNALILPYFDYCSSSWYSGISAQLRNRLNTFQRKLVRFIHGYGPMHHVEHCHFRNLEWLAVPDRVTYFKLTHLFKIRFGKAPPYLSTGFVTILKTHSYSTRGSESNYRISRDIALSPTSFVFTAINSWNGLPIYLKRLDSLVNFKKKLKQFLLSKH